MFYQAWVAQGAAHTDVFLSVFKQRINDILMQNLSERLEGSSREISQFQFQPYLENINVYIYMNAVCKLHMSSHRLATESGRWARSARIPIEERKCVYCDLLEDKFHFVLECKCYTELRNKYIPRYFFRRPFHV